MASAGESANRSLRVQVYQELKLWLRTQPVPERIRFLNDLARKNERFSLRLLRSVHLPVEALIDLLPQRLGGHPGNAAYIVKCFEPQLGRRRFWRLVKKHLTPGSPMFLALDVSGGGTLSRRLSLSTGEQASVPFLGAYIAVLALALCFFSVATAPAWVMARVVDYASRGRVGMDRTEGSFWQGKAAFVNYQFKDGSGRRLQNFSWELLPARLLRGEAAARVTLADSDGTLDAIVGMRGSRPFASGVQVSFPAPLLRGVAPLLELWSPGGVVRIDAAAINLNPLQVTEPAKARWQGASLTLSPVAPLGDYELDITPQGDSLALNLQTTSGALLVKGSGQYTQKSGGEFSGKAQAAPGFDEPLAPLLQIMGQAAGDGSVNVLAKLPALP